MLVLVLAATRFATILGMSRELDRLFPPEECLSADAMQMAEDILDRDIVSFFKTLGPYDSMHKAATHIQSPFEYTYEDCHRGGVTFQALYAAEEAMSEILHKIPRQTLPE